MGGQNPPRSRSPVSCLWAPSRQEASSTSVAFLRRTFFWFIFSSVLIGGVGVGGRAELFLQQHPDTLTVLALGRRDRAVLGN